MKKSISVFLAIALVLTNFQGWSYLKQLDLSKGINLFSGIEKSLALEKTLLEGTGLYYAISEGEAVIMDANTSISGDLVIPETIKGYPVTTIASYSFEKCSNLESVEIPKGVISIGDYAFSYCKSLKNIKFSDDVLTIGEGAFWECSSLESIEIPKKVKTIENYTFNGCTSLSNIVIPKDVTSIGEMAFSMCSSLTSVEIPEGLTIIEFGVFNECRSLSSVTIPNGVTSIGKFAFAQCNLTSIEIPESVTTIKQCAFIGTKLNSVRIAEGLTTIESQAFASCTELNSIIIPKSVTSMSEDTFTNSNKLTIYGYKNSYAESYAAEKNIPFEELGIYLNTTKLNLVKNNTYTLTATMSPEGFAPNDIKWSSSDENIVSVDQNGNIKGISIGTAIITVSSEELGLTSTCEVTVTNNLISLADITVEKDFYYYTGEQIKPSIQVKYGEKLLTEGTDYTVAYGENTNSKQGTITVTGINDYEGSKTIKFTIKTIDCPEYIMISSNTYNSISVKWSEVKSVDGYEVYRATSKDGTYSLRKTVTSGSTLSYTNTNVSTGKTYYYKIRSYKIVDGVKLYGQFSEPFAGMAVPNAPTVTATSKSYRSNQIEWSKVTGANGYEVYMATSENGRYALIATIKDNTTLSYTNTGLKTGKAYYYKVRAYKTVNGRAVNGRMSEIVSATPVLPTPVATAASKSYNSNKVEWNKVSGASGYEVYRATSEDGIYSLRKTVTSDSTLSYTNTSLKTGRTYYYKVRAYRIVDGEKVYGEFSKIVSATPVPANPVVTLSTTSKKITVKWGKVTGASGYEVYRATSRYGTYSLRKTVTSGSTLSYTNTGLTKGKTYYYKVRAYKIVDGNKVYGNYSSVKYITCK